MPHPSPAPMTGGDAMLGDSPMAGPDQGASPPTGPIALTMTLFPDGRVQVSDPMPADEGPMPAGPDAADAEGPMGAGPPMNTMTDETMPGGDASAEAGGQMFPTLDRAVRHLVQVAQAVGAPQSEHAAMTDEFGDGGPEPEPAGGY